MNTLMQSRQELESRIIDAASQDPRFRQRLLDDSREALSDFLGTALPPGMTVTVLEEQPGRHYLVLPPAAPDVDALPLDELALALVGGGRTLRTSSNTVTPKEISIPPSDPRNTPRGSC